MERKEDFSLSFSDTFQTHRRVAFWEAALKTCRCWQLNESSAATRREREQSSGWHHPVNNLSSLSNIPARWNCDFFVVSKVLADTPEKHHDSVAFGAPAQTHFPCSWLPTFLFTLLFYIPVRSWFCFMLFLTLGFNTRCCSVRTFPFYIPRALHQLSHLLCSPRGDFTISCRQHNLRPDVQEKFHCQTYSYRRGIVCCEVGTSPES